ncbi:MAG: hypothetical protein GYA33_05865, partial [Thermogutta sp.]|nr:hypothetical protein [Thermogutta sp.]
MSSRLKLLLGKCFSPRLLLAVQLGVCSIWGLSAAAEDAESTTGPRQAGVAPNYPRVNLSTWYEVDPAWPKRPADVAWGQMPAVAV